MLKIGVVGYSSGKFDSDLAQILVGTGLDYLVRNSSSIQFDLVSGLTNTGIPAMAYRVALARGWRTTGIACSLAHDFECFDVDEEIIVGDQWGDESSTFLNHVDCLLRVGGGDQSHAEVAAFRQLKPYAMVLELELERK